MCACLIKSVCVYVPTCTIPQRKEAVAEAATSTANAQQSEAAIIALQQQLEQQQQQYQQQLHQQQQQHQQQLDQLQQQLQQLRDENAVELLRLQAASTSQEEMMGVIRAKRESIAASAAQLQQLERSRECCICFGVMGGGDMAALLPCGQLLCRECAPRVEVQAPCPTCRVVVTGYHNVHIG